MDRKIFAGARLKRVRARLGVSQTQMAAALGLSPSYLNLIERDQRPLTVQVLLKLSAVYGIDGNELASEESTGLVEALKEVFSDPLITGEIASPAELSEFAEAAPNAARATQRLYAAWRESLERLSDLSHRMTSDDERPAEIPGRFSGATAVAWFEQAGAWFSEIEHAAEKLSISLTRRDDPGQALRAHLRDAFGIDVRILPRHVMPIEQARYDRHSQRLFISESVPLRERPFLLARQAALSGFRELLDQMTAKAGLIDAEAARICRAGFVNRLANAILAPADRLAEAARETGIDVIRLGERFGLPPLRVMARLAALGAEGRRLPSSFLVVVDASGGVLLRIPGAGFPFPRFGPFCARLPIFDGLLADRPLTAELVLPDNSAFIAVALAEEGKYSPDLPSPRRLALLGWRREEAGDGLQTLPRAPVRPIGVTCRLCERADCAHRLYPTVTRPAGFQEHVVGPSDHELLS